MPIFEKPPLESLPPARDRWTPIYLEHGRLEVDDSSVKWLGADGLMCRIPVATLSAVVLGPGTTITHAAIKACADSNTPVCWTGADGLRFYSFGLAPNHANDTPRLHATAWADRRRRVEIAREMFRFRFPDTDVEGKTVPQLRGMEGIRVRQQYADIGRELGVSWKARNYDTSNWEVADEINQALSTANACFYALCSAVICSMGFLPSLGFIHDSGTTPFVFDIADLYKHETTIPAAFLAARQKDTMEAEAGNLRDRTIRLLKQKIEEQRILKRMPKDLAKLMGTVDQDLTSATGKPPSATR